MESKLIAVAGATGTAGREIVRALAERGHRVRALVRAPERLGDTARHCAETRVVQVTQRETLRGALDGADMLVSAVGKTSQKDKTPRRVVDVDANAYLFAEAAAAGVSRVGFVSVAGARSDHPVRMIAMKGDAEARLEEAGVPWVVVQPTGYFSDMWSVFEMCDKGTLWDLGGPPMRFNPIAPADLGDFVAERLLDDGAVGQRFPVGGPEPLTLADIADMAERVLGRPVKRRKIPLWLARAGVACIRPFDKNAWELADFFVGQAVYAARHHGGDATVPAFGARRLEDYLRERWARAATA